MLDGRAAIPISESILADGMHHPVHDTGEEVLTERWTGLSFGPGNHLVDDGTQINILINLGGQPECAELFDFEFNGIFVTLSQQAGHLFRRAEVDLRDDLGAAIDAGDLAHVEVGSSFFGFDVKMSHARSIQGLTRDSLVSCCYEMKISMRERLSRKLLLIVKKNLI
jgi:hypothetical protein